MTLSIGYTILFYAATLMLVIGVARKIVIYSRTPQALKIPTTPAPTTKAGVVWRMTKEVTVFQSLFKANKWTWLFGWVFHVALLFILLLHLRYFINPVWAWVSLLQPFSVYAAFAMLAGLASLWARRFLVDRVRYISSPSDHLLLALLIAIGISGLTIKYLSHTDIAMVMAFMQGLIHFDLQPLAADGILLLHLSLVLILMIIFPISKLLHAPGLFFMPSRNQVDNPREVRHTAGWTAE